MRDTDDFVRDAAEHFGLGELLSEPAALHGGVNRVWKVTSEHGVFALHEMLGIPSPVDPIERCQQIFALEHAAVAAGISLARPVPEPATGNAGARIRDDRGCVTVHEWVDGRPAKEPTPSPGFSRRLGGELARLHRLRLAPPSLLGDTMDSRPTIEEWEGLANAARAAGWPWAESLRAAAGELVAAATLLDEWDAGSSERPVFSHRDLTPDNVLDDRGRPVLIDWESAGPTGRGTEIGRTALDHLSGPDGLDPGLLRGFLAGYAGIEELPRVGHDWCTLWIRALITFAEQCARSCVEGRAPSSLLEFQSFVVSSAPGEIRKRLQRAGELVAAFEQVSRQI